MLIEAATPADGPGIARVALAAGQPVAGSGADPAYLGQLLAVGTVLVARDPAGAVAGFGATVAGPLGEMLTDLFVDPARHGEGVGSRLLHGLWPDPGAGGRLTFSSGHPAALPLYVRAGLVPGWPLLYLRGPAPRPAGAYHVSVTATRDAAAADRRLTGGPLAPVYGGAPGDGLVVHDGGRLVAAGVCRGGELTHLTCPPGADAAGVLRAVLHTLGGEVTLCLPGPHPAVAGLLAGGFRVGEFDIVMHTRDVVPPVTWAYSPGLG